MKEKPQARESKKLKTGVIIAAVIVPVVILIVAIAAGFIWRRYGLFFKLKKGDDLSPVMKD